MNADMERGQLKELTPDHDQTARHHPEVQDHPTSSTVDGQDPDLILAAALAYAERGRVVVPTCWADPCPVSWHEPCDTPGKRPLVKIKDRDTVTPDEIKRWWRRWPDANVAILTGARSGLVVIDLDGPEGEAALARVEAEHGTLPPTLEVRTKRGRHLYLAHPGGKVLTRKGSDFWPLGREHANAKGLDVRGDGGLVVAPPSSRNGTAYSFANDLEPAPLPAGWIGPISTGTMTMAKPRDHDQGDVFDKARDRFTRPDNTRRFTLEQAQDAIEKHAIDKLRDHEKGRNRSAYEAGLYAGHFVGRPWWTEDFVADILADLAEALGLDRDDARRQIVNGIRSADWKAEPVYEGEPPEDQAQDDPDLFMDGETFLRQAMVTSPPIWGNQDMGMHLWARGESLMLVGPPGVGKSTLAHLLVWARLGLLDFVIDWRVEPSPGKVLYLAMDRPAQIGRAMARLVHPEHWPTIKDRLVVRMGPLPVDITQKTDWIRDKALGQGADLVVIDSIKDVVPKTSDEERGGLYNTARQSALAAGVDWLELHHNRKAGVGNKEPDTLEDVYGSRWLTAGAGSVISLFGESGASVVSMKQLKTPAGEFFPRWVELDKDAGQLSLHDNLTVESLVAKASGGTSAVMIARKIYGTEKPDRSQVQSVRNKLKRLTAQGLAEEYPSQVDGSQMFRAVRQRGQQRASNGPATGQQRDTATPATDGASAQVETATADSNNSNGSATFRGSLTNVAAGPEEETATCVGCGQARDHAPYTTRCTRLAAKAAGS